MRNCAQGTGLACVMAAFGILLTGGSGCKLESAVDDGVEGGVSDVVSGTRSEVVLRMFGIE